MARSLLDAYEQPQQRNRTSPTGQRSLLDAYQPLPPGRVPATPAPAPNAARPNQDAGLWSDTANLAKMGIGQLGQGAGYLTGIESLEQAGAGLAERSMQALSPAQQQASQNEFITHSEEEGYGFGPALTETPMRSLYGALVSSLPATAAGMGVGGIAAKGLGAVGSAMATRGVAGGATLARPAVSGAVGFGAGEGVVSAGIAGSDVKDFVRTADQELLDQAPGYQELIAQGLDPAAARETLAEELAGNAALGSGAIVGLLGAPMGAVFGRWMGGAGPQTMRGAVLGGAAGEAAQEAGQSAGEEYIGGTQRAQIDPTEAPTLASMANQAVGGALAGGAMGAGFGGFQGYAQQKRNALLEQAGIAARQAEQQRASLADRRAQATERVGGLGGLRERQGRAEGEPVSVTDPRRFTQPITPDAPLQPGEAVMSGTDLFEVVNDADSAVTLRAESGEQFIVNKADLAEGYQRLDTDAWLEATSRTRGVRALPSPGTETTDAEFTERRDQRLLTGPQQTPPERKRLQAEKRPTEKLEQQAQRLLTVDREKGLTDSGRETLDAVASVLLERPDADPQVRAMVERYGQPTGAAGEPPPSDRPSLVEAYQALTDQALTDQAETPPVETPSADQATGAGEPQPGLSDKAVPANQAGQATPPLAPDQADQALAGQPARPEPTTDRRPAPDQPSPAASSTPEASAAELRPDTADTSPSQPPVGEDADSVAPGDSAVEGLQVTEVPVADLVLSKDVPQFKSAASDEGVVEPLTGDFDRRGLGPIAVWERADGRREVISGRHRLDLARRTGQETLPAQVFREADGFTARDAMTLDAELNIRDQQGEVPDYANYFKGAGVTEAEAQRRGLLDRAKGRQGFAIAQGATDTLFQLHQSRADGFTDASVEGIAKAAPGDERLQNLAIQQIQAGKPIAVATGMIDAVRAMEAQGVQTQATTDDLFGFDDSAMKQAEALAREANARKKAIREQINAVRGAANRPEQAAKLGVKVSDPQGIKRRITQLEAEARKWEDWPTNPALRRELMGEALELTPESEADIKAREAEQKRRTGEQAKADKAAEQKAKADSQAKAPLTLGDQQTDLVSQVRSEEFADEARARKAVEPTGQQAEAEAPDPLTTDRAAYRKAAKDFGTGAKNPDVVRQQHDVAILDRLFREEIAADNFGKGIQRQVNDIREGIVRNAMRAKIQDQGAFKHVDQVIERLYQRAEKEGKPIPAFVQAERKAKPQAAKAEPKASGPAKVSDLDREQGIRAYSGISMSPERRADSDIEGYVAAVNGLAAELHDTAQTDEQHAVADRKAEQFRQGYIRHMNTLWAAKSRTVSPMVTGPANFPTRRNQKRLDTEQKRVNEFLEWERKARASAKAAVKGAATPEMRRDDAWAALQKHLDSSLASLDAIDLHGERGLDRALFASSIKGRLERLAASGETDQVTRALDYIRERQQGRKKPYFTPRNRIWELGKQAEAAAEQEQETVDAEPSTLAEYDIARVVDNPAADRIQILFEDKPGEAIRKDLRGNGWKWSPSEEAWQRKATNAARSDALRLLDKHGTRKAETRYSRATTDRDAEYLAAVDRGDMAEAQRLVDEAAREAGYKHRLYHGTPTAGFTVFKARPTYLTPRREVADIYQSGTASSIRTWAIPNDAKPATMDLYVKADNIFDTRTAKHRRMFEREFFMKGGEEWSSNGTPLSEKKLPDWTDGRDLHEWFEETGKPFDAMILDEGGLPKSDGTVFDRGESVVVWNPEQIKSAEAVTRDDNGAVIPLSQRFNPRSEDIRFARGTQSRNTAAAVRTELNLNRRAERALLDSGLVTIVQSASEIPGTHPSDVAGAYHQGKVYLVADNIPAGRARGLLYHEAGVHAGLETMVGPEQYAQIVETLKRQVRAGSLPGASRAAREAFQAHVRASADSTVTNPDVLWHETIAYLAESGSNAPVLRRIMAAVRAFLRRLGLASDFTAADMAQLARGSIQRLVEGMEAGGQPATMYHRVFHGTPHLWQPEPGFPHGRPRLDKIGTGEGHAKAGHGIYLAEEQATGVSYREQLAGASDGQLYHLDIPDNVIPTLLDWDAKLSDQPQAVQDAILDTDAFGNNVLGQWLIDEREDGKFVVLHGEFGRPLKKTGGVHATEDAAIETMEEIQRDIMRYLDGEKLYKDMVQAAMEADRSLSGPRAAKQVSETLRDAGIPGNRYLDAGSRDDGTGTSNIVLWSQDVLDRVALLKRNEEALDAIQAASAPQYSRAEEPESPPHSRIHDQADVRRLMPSIRTRTGKVEFTYDAKIKIDISPELQRALSSATRSILSSLSIYHDFEVRFSSTGQDPELTTARGYVLDKAVVNLRTSILNDWKRSGLESSYELFELIAHEFTHIKQHLRGELGNDKDGNITWMGRSADDTGKLYQNRRWESRPWEKEAIKMQGILSYRAIDDLISQGILPADMAPEARKLTPRHPDAAKQIELESEKRHADMGGASGESVQRRRVPKTPGSAGTPQLIRESEFEAESRKAAGYTEIIRVDARSLQRIFEAEHGESLPWNDNRSERLRDQLEWQAYPRVATNKYLNDRLEVDDGRHRIAVAAERGREIDVAIPPESRQALLSKIAQAAEGKNETRYSRRPADTTPRAALGRSLLARNRGDVAAAQREAKALYPGMSEDIGDWIEQNRDRWQESGDDVGAMYSRANAQDDARAVLQELDARYGQRPTLKDRAGNVGEWFGSLSRSNRRLWLNLLTRQQIVDVGKDVQPLASEFEQLARQMDADANKLITEHSKTIEGWVKKVSRLAGRANNDQAALLARTMHEATIAGFDPSVSKPTSPEERQVAKMWTALDAGSQKLFTDVRDAYSARREELERALVMRLAMLDPRTAPKTKDALYRKAIDTLMDREAAGESPTRRQSLTALRMQMENNRVKGPYFPLSRFGDYYVVATKAGEEKQVMRFERGVEWRRAQGELEAEGWTIKAGKDVKNLMTDLGPSANFMKDIFGVLDSSDAGLDQTALDAIKDDMWQMYLMTLPDQSIRKHFIHRQNRRGFSQDALRAFAHHMHHSGRQIARMRYSSLMADNLTGMKANIEGNADPEKASDILDGLGKSFAWMMNPTTATWATRATSFGFGFYLGVSPAAAMINMTQVPIVSLPILGAQYGGVKAARALSVAMKDYSKAAFSTTAWEKLLAAPGVGRMLREIEDSGAVDRTLASSVLGLDEENVDIRLTEQKIMEKVGFLFHKAERWNREITAIAAYRLAREANKSHEQGVLEAYNAIFETQFDYSGGNRAAFMRGNTARVLLLFRQYSQNMTYLLWRNFQQSFKGESPEVRRVARNKLMGILGTTGVFAGAMGMPLVGVMLWVSQMAHDLLDDDDEEWDAELALRQTMNEWLGPVADVAARGVFGAGIGTRTSLDELWVRSPYGNLEGRDLAYHYLEQAAGPVVGIGVSAFRGIELMSRGNIQQGFETALPKVIKDVLRAERYYDEGVQSLRGDQVVGKDELDWFDLALQASGVAPHIVTERYEQNRNLRNLQDRIIGRRRALINRYYMAWRDGDTETVRDTVRDMRAFSLANPRAAITGDTIRQSIRARARTTQKRTLSGSVFDQNLLPYLREQQYLN